jgi:Bromodomain
MEAECEKLLKALRHQSDLRYMSFFIQPNYPVDYTAFISKPMDWERVQRTLKKRHYDTIGALISDLRLIFTNAEKYNSRLKGTDTVSGLAYEAAGIMSKKLEVAINKLLLTVSDRLERERIDHTNAEREIEAAERAEEAEIRAAWNKQEQPFDKSGSAGGLTSSTLPPATSMRSELSQKTRIVRRLPQRTNFEVPFFDEDDSDRYHLNNNNTRSVGDNEAVKVQKALFEKQRYELSKMRAVSVSIGAAVFVRLLERQLMDLEDLERQQSLSEPADDSGREIIGDQGNDGSMIDTKTIVGGDDVATSATARQPSSVLEVLEKEGRGPLQIQFLSLKKKTNKKKRSAPSIAEGF